MHDMFIQLIRALFFFFFSIADVVYCWKKKSLAETLSRQYFPFISQEEENRIITNRIFETNLLIIMGRRRDGMTECPVR